MSLKFDVKSFSLGWYSSEEILKISCCEVTLPTSFDMFGHPVPDGLYDLRMGPLGMDYTCQTCSLGYLHCPGHFGHVKLSKVVLNPITFDTVYALVKACCSKCFHFKITSNERLVLYTKLKVLKRRLGISNVEAFVVNKTIEEIEKGLDTIEEDPTGYENAHHYEIVSQFIRKTSVKTTCPRCHTKSPKFTKGNNLRILRTGPSGLVEYVSPNNIRVVISELYENESALLSEMFNSDRCNMFFIDVLPLVPNKFRPAARAGNKISESPINSHFCRIINFSAMADNNDRFWSDLQAYVFFYFDNSKGPSGSFLGHKQILEKKDGLFRKNIMGKRVNYSARSVISPDPNLETREIGVPLVFATQLTFPEKVTSFNIDQMRRLVVNGTKYPGANFVQSNGALINLKYITIERRLALANQLMDGNKIVWRHLVDGDPLLVNRQPTLHSVSLMGHIAKVLKNEKTLRMHYVNCKSYNADFDGDEMNIHFPQSLNSISEIHSISLNDNSFFVPSSGEPIRGLTQDHIIAALCLTMKDSFFSKEEYHALVNAAISHAKSRGSDIEPRLAAFSEPCIQAPVFLYSGKQVVSTILKSLGILINFSVKSKVGFPGEEGILSIVNGEVISGALDKASVGASSFSLIHACGEIYGYSICNDLLTVISRAVNCYMLIRGFTIRFDDLLLDSRSDRERLEIFSQGNDLALQYQRLGCPEHFDTACHPEEKGGEGHPMFEEEDFYFDEQKVSLLDKKMRGFMNDLTTKAVRLLDGGMFKKFPTNNMVSVIQSGSKGTMVNLSQISGALGQQELEGRRVPFMESGKTLPCFKKMELCPSAGGFVFERFLTGINPATFYFHAMAGREGLIDTAVKTANSGYLQRCLAKHLEGVSVMNDGKVMSGNRIVQFKYGDDGIDCTKGTYLQDVEFYKSNFKLFKRWETFLEESQDTSSDNLISEIFKNSLESCPGYLRRLIKDRFLSSLVSPGHSVGIIAAQSLGEPSTQMTLNTFHLAGVGGKNVTLGIPRLREIIMVASKNIKTPIITAPLLRCEDGPYLQSVFKMITLEDCLENVTVQETFVVKDQEYKKHIKILFDIRSNVEACARVLDCAFLKALGKELKKRSSSSGITEYNCSAAKPVEDTDPAHSEDSNTSSSESEVEIGFDGSRQKDEEIDAAKNNEEGFLENLDRDGEDDESEDASIPLVNLRKITSRRFCFEIYYPSDFNILLMPIIESIAKKVVVRQVPGFKKASVDCGTIFLEGADFLSLTAEVDGQDLLDKIDFYNSHSNDIYAMYRSFGVEAAREMIVHEIVGVFDVYGIKIDIRHLYLVADYMTMDGTFKAFNRSAFTMDNSIVQRMSFESCFTNLKNAAIFHKSEIVENPSSCLLTGSILRSGTGAFELLYDMASFAE